MTDSMLKQLTDLPGLSLAELKKKWQSLFGTDSPS